MALKALMRIQLLKELTSLVKALKEGGLKPIERLGKIKRVGEVRRQLTNAPLEAYAKEADNAPAKKSLGTRQKLNNAAIEALRKVQSGDAKADDPAIREALKGYSGSGGGLKSASGESGSPHEYYTPKPVAHAMWTLLSGLGFTGGKVLDPSAGMGVFAQTKPSNVAVEQVELDNVSGEINSILNDSATVSTKVSPFEAMAAETEDESYDAVVTNVPFGDHAMRGAAYKLDKKYQKANLQEYFLLRGLDKIRAGGYASFIVPSGVVSGKGGRAQKLRVALSFKSEFIGAYRLPNQVFDEAGADVITDVVIFRKHGKEQFAKIEELKQQSATVLTEAKVLWDVFLDGNYFKLDGKKYQIGESTMGMGKFGEVEKVVYAGDIVSVAKLMRPFDKTGRIDWELLNTVETAPIVYSEGDTVYSGGALLQFKDGALVPVEGGIAVTDDVAEATKAKIGTVFDCVNNGVTLEDVTRVVENETREGRINDLPMWVRAVSRFGAAAGQAGYIAAVTGLCVRELADKDGKNNGTNYGEQFPTLSGLLAKSKRDAAKLKSKSGGNELIGTALASVSLACNKSGFTPWWKGEINAKSQELMRPESAYDKAKNELAEGDEYVDVATIKAASSSFDPLNDDEYAISADGSGVMHIKDYYVGSYKDFLERAKQELEQATDPAVKEKLLKQHARAMSQLSIVNVSDMAFNLHSPYVSNEDKLAFLKQYVDSSYELSTNADGDVTFAYAAGTLSKNATANEELNDKIKRRLVHYLNKGTVRTGSRNDDIVEDPEAEKILQEQLSAFISQTNSSFDSWVKASELKDKIGDQLNAPENLRFTEIPDYAPLDIENWNPERKPHGYQSAAVRRFAKRFSGILGLDVGLGKTLTALAAVQQAHNIGTKKRTVFALPNSVLSNWKKEAEMAYRDVSDCLYVGLRKKGSRYKYDSGVVDEDLAAITSGRYSKIFMTYEVLGKIPMRDETVTAYSEYLLGNDDSIGEAVIEQGESKKGKGTKARDKFAQENAIAKAVTSGRKSMSVPYFEDMSIDSIVVDEAHAFKNSKRFTTTGNGAFTATKFVANPSTSDRGMDAQMKCWYVRGMSEGGDGVMALTATPVTNSPLEIYSMLSVAIGEKEVNAMMGCMGANSFMNAVCKIADQAEQTVTGEPKVQRTLTGIDNLQLVRRVLESACIIETAESVAAKGIIIQVPESEEVSTSVELPVAMTNELMKMKEAYKKANAAKKSGATLTGSEAKAASPFNLIRNMSKLIADEELYRGTFKFTFAKQDAGDAKKAVDAFNAMNITEERSEHELPAGFDPNTANGGKPVKSKAITNEDTGEEELVFYVPIKAKIESMVIEVPAVTYDAQDKLIKQLEKFGVEPLFSKASPKINALLANVKEENANPRWKPPKQIVFCDELALHHKLRLMISAETGIPKSKIIIVNAKSVSPADIQGVQDGFNASGDDAEGDDYNKYQIIIANKKAEVGINLQSGTQAVHHMTIGWTPDSVHQRNGRAVRQGNKIDTPIRIYHYDAAGTFDSYKRHLVNVKGDWIASIMDKDAKSVDIAGDLTTEDYENMANAIGDSQAMSRIQAESAAKAQKKLLQANMTAQTNSAANMKAAGSWLDKHTSDSGNAGFVNWYRGKNSVVAQFNEQISSLQDKLDKTDNVMMQKRHSVKISEIEVKRDAAKAQIAGVTINSYSGEVAVGFEASEAYKNYQKEVALNTKMRDEARNSFLLRDNLGYTKASLESLEADKAVIIGGRVVSSGDFMDVNGGLGVVVIAEERNYRRGGRSTIEAVTMLWVQGEDGYRKMPLNSVSVNRHAPIGTKAHTDMLKELAAVCDKAVQNGYKERGVWEFAPAISEAMSEVLPSPWFSTVNGNEYGFKAPLFPVYLNDHFGAEFDDLRAKQKELIEVKTDWQSKFRFHDLKNMVAIDDADAAIKAWLTANNRKLSAESASDLRFDIEESAMEAHKAAVAASTTVGQYNDALVRKISDAEPAIEFKTADDVVAVLGKYSAAMREIKKTHNALDDGSNPLPFDIEPSDIKRYGFPNLTDKLLAAIGNGEADESIYKNDLVSRAHGTFIDFEPLVKLFVKLNGGSSDGDKITFAGDLANQLRAYFDLGASSIPKLSEYAFLKLLESTYARTIGSMAKSWNSQKAIKESKVNIDGMIEALKSFDSINKIELGNTIYVKAKSRYSGSVTMQAGQYVILDLAYKGKIQSAVSNKENSLSGRLFDDGTKRWYFPLMPLSFSDGKPVATVKDLLIHLGESEKAKEIFGA